MKTSNGMIQGYNGIAAVDKRHQIVVSAEVFGQGSGQSALPEVLAGVQNNFTSAGVKSDLIKAQIIVTADTGFASAANMYYPLEQGYNAYVPAGQFRSRDATESA